MKYNKIMLFFSCTLVISVVVRIVQLLFVIEENTGFYKPQYETIGFAILIFIFAINIIGCLFAFTAHRNPKNPPKINAATFVSSVLLSVLIFLHTINPADNLVLANWQSVILKILGYAAFLYFFLYGLQYFKFLYLPQSFSIVPTLYLIIRIICDFTTVSSVALISDNVILLSAYCSALWFMLQFAKLNNNALSNSGFKGVLASGLLSSTLCFTQSIPHFVVNIITGYDYLHTSIVENLVIFFLGMFIFIYIITYFSKKNSCI